MPEFIVKRDRYRYGRVSESSLHDPVAAPLADRLESIAIKNNANLRARKDAESTQSEPLPE